jgi:putative membrane protein
MKKGWSSKPRLQISGIPPQHMASERSTSFFKALLAGLAGGLVGSAAKSVTEKLLPPRTRGQTPPPQILVERAEAATETKLPPTKEKAATSAIHWTFGTVTGGIYGLAAEYQPRTTAWAGAAFGLTLNRLTHEGFLPRAGLVEPVPEQPAQERVSEWVTHIAYGVTTELVRRFVRKRL